jgi:hypothetical protein
MSNVESSHRVVFKFFDISVERATSLFKSAEFLQADDEHLTTTCKKPKDSHHFNNGYENMTLVMIKLHTRKMYFRGDIP